MTDSYDEDESGGKDTQILPAVDGTAPHDLQGTVEMERKPLLTRRNSHDATGPELDAVVERENEAPATLRLAAIGEQTRPAVVKDGPTAHFEVPHEIISQLRDDDDELQTLDVTLELIDAGSNSGQTTGQFMRDQLAEFQATIDENGRICVPDAYLRGRFPRGARVHIVMRTVED